MSPIKGISEVIRLPRLGKIRLGIKEEGAEGESYPSPTDYFVCPEEVRNVFGEKPRELRIMFPNEDSEQWASHYLRCYSASRDLICRGDGQTALAKVDTCIGESRGKGIATPGLVETICRPSGCDYFLSGQCRRVMNLQFLLPDCPGFGVYQLDTSSYNSMTNINSFLEFIRGISPRVSMIPLSLQLVEKEVQPEGLLKTAYVLKLTCPYSLSQIQRFARVPPGQVLLLPPPDSEAPDDLFPSGVIAAGQGAHEPADANDKLLDLWARAKSKIFHHDIQDSQIIRWFEKNCRIPVRLRDFEPVTPPAKLTAGILAQFCEAVDRHTGR